MDNLPLVSIALCTYNGERFLAQQLETLVNQTYANLEIIAVDDRSTDNTLNILDEYAARYPKLTVYQNEYNKGFLRNFETAALYCKGEFIAFSDQDDLWELNKIELMVNAIGDNQLLYHDSELINDSGESLGKKMSDVFNFYRGDRPEVFLFDNCVSGHAMMIRKDLLKHAFPLKETYFHDWWLAYVAANIGTIDFIPQPLVKYRQHEKSSTDVLWIDKKKRKKRNSMPQDKRISIQMGWLQHCMNFPGNKDPAFVRTLYKLFIDHYDSFTSYNYFRFLKKNVDILYFISRHSMPLKMHGIRKFKWGLKGKNFWYTYIRPDTGKILHYTIKKISDDSKA